MTAVSPAPDGRGSGLDSSALVRRLPGTAVYHLEVVGTDDLSASMRRLRFAGDGLGALAHQPGQDLMFAVPDGHGGTFRRRYTIRHLGGDPAELAVDIVLHGDGPGAAWAAAAGPGTRVEALGPRGKVVVDPGATWHLFGADESGLPASLAMAESLPAGSRAVLVLEVDGPNDHLPFTPPDDVATEVRWLHRDGAEPGAAGLLAPALGRLALPDGPGHAYLAGELREVAAARRVLIDKGLGAERISAKPYWRRGVANAAHGEPGRDE